MTRFLGLLAAAFALLALPAAAHAAQTPCGFLSGQFDISGRTYSAQVVWPQRTLKGLVTLNANCSAMLSLTGQDSVMGSWTQKDGKMSMKFVGLDFLGNVANDGGVDGQMVNSIDDVGTFRLTAPGGRSAAPATNGSPGSCGKGDASHPYMAGRVYYGALSWQGEDKTLPLTLTFKADCSMGYLYDNGSVGWATWAQDGGRVTLRMTDGFASYDGRVAGDRFSGALANIEGKTGTFEFTRRP